MNFGYFILKDKQTNFAFRLRLPGWLFPAQTTIFKEISWSKDFNDFSTPYHIPWICIIWTIFLEAIFQSGAQHFICMNAFAWVIHASKLWMYKRGPGVWTKNVTHFSSASSGSSGKGQRVVWSGENHTAAFILAWGKDPLDHPSLHGAVLCRLGGCTPMNPTSPICVGRLWDCAGCSVLTWWTYGSSHPHPARGAALEASLNYCSGGGYWRACGWRSALPSAFTPLLGYANKLAFALTAPNKKEI